MPIELIKHYLQNWFDFPNKKLFCQVATFGNNSPHVRTMDLYHITDEGNVILLTETSTRKWHDLKENPTAAICIVNQDFGQILANGQITLNDFTTDSITTKYYWDSCLDDYWRNFYLKRDSNNIAHTIPSSFGVIILQPRFWEILVTNQNDFLKSSRKQYHKNGETWSQSEVDPV